MRYNKNQRKGIGKWSLSILLAASITLSFVPESALVLDTYAKESAAGEQTDAGEKQNPAGESEKRESVSGNDKQEAAVSALLALEDMAGANVPELLATNYDVSTGSVIISTDGDYTVTGTTTTNTITVNSGISANIILNNVSIDVSGIEGAAAFRIEDDSSGNVTVTLEGSNILKSGADCAGLQKNGESDVGTLTIKGTGSLTAVGGGSGAGIGGSGSDSRNGTGGSTAHITIEDGTITAQGGTIDVPLYGEMFTQIGGAGIGGGACGSGSDINITGGKVNATGGAGTGSGGAGIGGGYNGSGTVTICGNADVTAQGGAIAAGIGAGCNSSIKTGHSGTVTIEGGTVIATGGTNSSCGGAGIGAGYSSHANVTINGGTVTATGGSNAGTGSGGAGIGSSGGMGNATVKISGGTVKAQGGDDENGGAGIGGGVSIYAVNVTISGGTVTATGGSNVSSDGSGGPGAGIGLNAGGRGSVTFSTDSGNAFIIATGGVANGDGITGDVTSAGNGLIINGETTVWGATSYTLSQDVEIPTGVTLTIPNGKTLTVNSTLINNGTLLIEKGGTLSGGTLNGNGNFVTTELTEDMITVPTGLFYDGTDRTNYIEQNTTLATKTYCGKAFRVTGWTQQSVTKAPSSDLIYTVTYTPDAGIDSAAITKTVTLGKSGTQFTDDGKVTAYKGNTAASEFVYGETITVKAIPTATGRAPAKAGSRLRTLAAPTAGQMALYYNDTQVSEAVSIGTDGSYAMTVRVKDLITDGAKYHEKTTLTAKFVGDSLMADGEGTVAVTLKPTALTITGATLDAKTYDGTTTATVTGVQFNGLVNNESLTLNTDYTAEAKFKDANAGTGKTATVTVTLEDTATAKNYSLSSPDAPATGTIHSKTVSAPAIELSADSFVWDGTAKKPVVTVKDGNTVIPDREYTVNYENNINVGTATVTVTDKANGNYVFNKVSENFTIEKASQAAPVLSYEIDRTDKQNIKITIYTVKGAQYSFDGGNTWQDENEQDGFGASQIVTLAIRLKETATHNPSAAQTVTVDLAKKDREAPEAFTLKYAANGKKDYTVTIPLTEGCEYSFDGVDWSDNNVKTGVAAGETVTGYKRYKETSEYNTGVAASDTKRMPEFQEEKPAVSQGESSGGSGKRKHHKNNKEKDENGGADTALQTPVTPPVTPPAVDTDTNPGTGTAEKPVSGNPEKTEGNAAQQTETGTEKPFIKGKDGKIGWDVIRAEEEKTEEGSVINVDMNGATVVPGDIFDSIRGKDITITFDMGDGILWSVDGKSITVKQEGDIDFSVKTGTNAIPVEVVNEVTGESYSIQISLAHEGEFGFTAVLSINLGSENAGYTASLYYYKESTGELEFICRDTIAEDGTASLSFTHASDYVLTIVDGESGVMEPVRPEGAEAAAESSAAGEGPEAGQEKKTVWPVAAGVIVLAGIVFAGVFVWKKKEEKD